MTMCSHSVEFHGGVLTALGGRRRNCGGVPIRGSGRRRSAGRSQHVQRLDLRGEAMTATEGLRYIDSDGHILEHPTAMPDYAPAEYRDRDLAHRDRRGRRRVAPLQRHSSCRRTACRSPAPRASPTRRSSQVRSGEIRYTEVRPAAYNAKARLQDMDTDGIDLAVLYPTSHARAAVRSPTRSSPRVQAARVQRLGVGPHPGGRGPAVRGRRGAADARRRRRAGGRRRDPPRRREAGHGVGVPAPEPVGRLAAVQRPGLRPGVAGRGRHRPRRSRSTRS